jgi:hypothetical protein
VADGSRRKGRKAAREHLLHCRGTIIAKWLSVHF